MTTDDRILEQAADWHRAGRKVALATVVTTWGSSPRPVAASWAVDEEGRKMIGSSLRRLLSSGWPGIREGKMEVMEGRAADAALDLSRVLPHESGLGSRPSALRRQGAGVRGAGSESGTAGESGMKQDILDRLLARVRCEERRAPIGLATVTYDRTVAQALIDTR